jgi:AAA15 family ATPase/GTPase
VPIRIEHINIKQDGPLNEDFLMKPTDLNIIYGHNETGKSYIVENIINLTVNNLVSAFEKASGEEFADDSILLQEN